MYDGTRVMLGAFKQLLNEYPAIFAKNFRRGEVYNNNTRGIDCKREKVIPWEHGNEIFHRLRNVSIHFSEEYFFECMALSGHEFGIYLFVGKEE